MQKFKDFFYDDLSVTRGNYFLTLMAAFFITIILFIGIVVSEVQVKSRLLCKMLYNVFTISTYQN
ncbi:hypothetical protein W308_01927 [Staphylococcus aureus DAR5869]|nr:hypothetical protein W308_01927 [Staphylococcus aureus DAR5869]